MPAKFRSNKTKGAGVITAYQFFKMAALESEIYFRVRFGDCSFEKLKTYLHIKFR